MKIEDIGKSPVLWYLLVALTFVLAIMWVAIVATALQPDYIIDGDTVYVEDENVYISTNPHTVCGEGWVTSKFIFKNYNGNVDVAYGFNTSSMYPTAAELYAPHEVHYTTQHQAWFYNVSSITNTPNAVIDYENDYNTHRYTINYQKCAQTDEETLGCNEWVDATAVAAFDSYDTDGTNYTAYWHTQQTRTEDWKDISHLFKSVDYDHDGKNKWYYVTDIPVIAGEIYTVRTYIKVDGIGDNKYDVAAKPSSETIPESISNGHFYILDPWAEVSELELIDPTPANESTIYVDHTTINVSIATSDLTYFTFNWNGTNYTYTTCGTKWNQSTDSYERTTTVGSYTQPDFDNISPWSHARRCTLWDNGTVNYYLDAANSSLKANGELADLTGADGQVNGSYTISASKSGYFINSTVAVVSGNVSNINITLFFDDSEIGGLLLAETILLLSLMVSVWFLSDALLPVSGLFYSMWFYSTQIDHSQDYAYFLTASFFIIWVVFIFRIYTNRKKGAV